MSAISELNFETGIAGLPERHASLWGFRSGDRGTHTSRTIMLDELSQLLDAVPGEARRQDYADAVTHDNCLGKRTAATRQLSLQRLTELYGLDGRLLLFRALRNLWGRHSSSRPLLALLLALVRDPLLRATAGAVIATPLGHEFGRQAMKDGPLRSRGGPLERSDARQGGAQRCIVLDAVRPPSRPRAKDQTARRSVGGSGSGDVRIADRIRGRASRPIAVRDTVDRDSRCISRRPCRHCG